MDQGAHKYPPMETHTGNILKCMLYTHYSSGKSSLRHQSDGSSSHSEAEGLEWPSHVLPHFGPSSDLFKPFKWWSALSQLQIDYSLTWMDTEAPSLLPPFHSFIPNHFTSICSTIMMAMHRRKRRGLHRGELPLLPYHHNHYQQQPSHGVMRCLGTVIIQLGDGRRWQCLGLCCFNDNWL